MRRPRRKSHPHLAVLGIAVALAILAVVITDHILDWPKASALKEEVIAGQAIDVRKVLGWEEDAPPFKYEWRFGDGGTSTERNPTHTYLRPGWYDVTLTVQDTTTGLYGTTTKWHYVDVYADVKKLPNSIPPEGGRTR